MNLRFRLFVYPAVPPARQNYSFQQIRLFQSYPILQRMSLQAEIPFFHFSRKFEGMTYGKLIRISFLLTLFVLALFIFFISGNHGWIEKNYSSGFFPVMASNLRILFGWLPFSIGDMIYSLVAVSVLWQIGKFIVRLFHRTDSWKKKLLPLLTAGIILLFVYVYFYLFWGLNYYRKGIEYQLGLQNGKFEKQQLIDLNRALLVKLNATKESCLLQKDTIMNRERMFQSSMEGYRKLEQKFSFIHYRHTSLKPSMFGKIGNYVGFQGYYNPFTGEGQVNTQIPNFLQPYVTCHEMAHQIGYASESEANLVGFLAATHSADTLMQYSAYLDMFLYAWNNLRAVDSTVAKDFGKQIHAGVKRDLKTYAAFAMAHRSFLQDWTDAFYDFYLKQNRQRKGIGSYAEVTGWVIAYRKKFGPL